MNQIKFNADNEEHTVGGDKPIAALIADATLEHGEIEVIETTEHNDSVFTEQTIAILTAVDTNLTTTINQLESLDEHFPMPNTKQRLFDAQNSIKKALKELNER